MADMKQVQAKLTDTATLARLIANPKAVATELGVDEKDERAVRALERLAFTGQKMLSATGAAAGLAMKETNVGIGMGCCNSKLLAFASFE